MSNNIPKANPKVSPPHIPAPAVVNEPVRYSIVADFKAPWAKMVEFRNGEFIRWDDYAVIRKERDELKSDVKRLNTELSETRGPLEQYEEHFEYANNVINNLENEVKRLKALDSIKTVSLTDSTNWTTIGAYAEAMEENARLKVENEKLMTNPTSRILREERDNNLKLKKEVEFLKGQYSEAIAHFREMRIEKESINEKVKRLGKWMDEIFEDAEARMDSGQLVGFKLLNIKRRWEIEKKGNPSV